LFNDATSSWEYVASNGTIGEKLIENKLERKTCGRIGGTLLNLSAGSEQIEVESVRINCLRANI